VHLQVGPTDFGTAKDLYYYDADSNTDRKYSAAVASAKEVTVLSFHEATAASAIVVVACRVI
jgi:hypothetical protein